jgi:LysM repeat protein
MGMLSVNNVGKRSRNAVVTSPTTVIQTVEVPFPVLIDRYNIMAKSDNATLDTKTFYGYGKLQILLYPFDNVLQFVIATGTAQSPVYLDLSRFSQHQIVFRTDQTVQSFPIFLEANDDLSIGNITFKIPQAKYSEIKKIYNQNVNVFYITATSQGTSSVIYTGLFKVYDNAVSVAELNQQAGTPGITLDTSLPKETAIVTRKPIREMLPTLKPSNMKNNSLLGGISNAISNVISAATGNTENDPTSPYTEYVTQSQQTAKSLANAIGMPLNDFANINNIQPIGTIKAKTVVKVPSNLAFKTPFLVPKK